MSMDRQAWQYALATFLELRDAVCLGGDRHEGPPAGRLYCDECLIAALAAAWTAGRGAGPGVLSSGVVRRAAAERRAGRQRAKTGIAVS